MSEVTDKVLAWLYGVLHEYRDPQRTYTDIARALGAYPSLSPRTEIYTSENGSSALLLTLLGTIPASFRNTTYRFPIKVWVPSQYPQEPPIVYVTPAKDMLVRPGQHVGPDGRIYHPYLKDWKWLADQATIMELLAYIQQVFAKEPPVISRPPQRTAQPTQPQEMHRVQYPPQGNTQSRSGTPQYAPSPLPNVNAPPPRPPKQQQHEQPDEPANRLSPATARPPPLPQKANYSDHSDSMPRDHAVHGPSLPPLPKEHRPLTNGDVNTHNQQWPPYTASPAIRAPGQDLRRYDDGRYPSHPHFPQSQTGLDGMGVNSRPRPHNGDRSSPRDTYQEQYAAQTYSQPLPLQYQTPQQSEALQHSHTATTVNSQTPQVYGSNYQSFHQSHHHPQPPPSQHIRKQPPPDLLSDPFDVTLPVQTQNNLHAPPIPPNPEREHLLQALSVTLVKQAQQQISQNASAMSPLQAQHDALMGAQARIAGEIRQLEQISQTIELNERILHRAIRECEHTIESAKSKPLPPVDDILVPPTLVAQQLWSLLAEEAAIREAMYILQKGVDSGRVSCEIFVKQMRSLGREAFLKMALARKCAQGMGLELR